MQIKTTADKYGIIRRANHWLVATIFIGLLAIGLYMKGMDPTPEKWQLYGFHKSFGVVILVLVLFRIIWLKFDNRIDNSSLTKKERILSASMHGTLYLIMLIMPISGLLMSMFGGHKVVLFNTVTLPMLVEQNSNYGHLMSIIHEYVGYFVIGLIILHVLASLFHHFIKKDNVLKRML